MTYFLNLSLPLWATLLPLCIAVYLANKYYKWKAKYYAATCEAQKEIIKLNTDLIKRKEDFIAISERLIEKTKQCHKLESDAIEREAHIIQLQKNLSLESEILQERISDKNRVISALHVQIEQLISDKEAHLLRIDELIETIGNLDAKCKSLEKAESEVQAYCQELIEANNKYLTDLNAAIGVINRTKRAAKQWAKYEAKKTFDSYKPKVTYSEKVAKEYGLKSPKDETITHDALGVARVFQADQSESVNNRHGKLIKQALQKGNEIIELCNEVNRGIAEQAERIRQELEVVDMSTLESGDSVKFRNGIVRKVSEIAKYSKIGITYDYRLRFDLSEYGITDNRLKGIIYYTRGGNWYEGLKPFELDIIQIIKA